MKISIKFSLAPAKSSDLPIRIRVSYGGMRLELRSGFVCPPDKWDTDAMRMKAGTSNRYKETAASINRELSKQEAVLSELLSRHELDGDVPEPHELKSEFDMRLGRTKAETRSISLFDGFAMFLSDPCLRAANSQHAYMTVHRKLADMGIGDIAVDELTDSSLSEFLGELWSEGFENESAKFYIARIKSVLRYLADKGLYNGRLHDTFRPKIKGLGMKDVHYLEWSEFLQILDVPLATQTLESVRDSFCFSCCTGLRVSDCSSLRWSQVNLTADTPYISIIARKTTKRTIIELNQYSRKIIDRQLHDGIHADDLVFHDVCIQNKNILIKRIARIADIKGKVRELSFCGNRVVENMVDKADAISTHWGRHTFIVRALSLGISPMVVMQWTGHASFDSMKPYIAIADSAKKKNMELFNT